MRVPASITKRLEERKDNGSYRSLKQMDHLVDFSSNDYLGLARNKVLKERIDLAVDAEEATASGGTGSRLISGNHVWYTRAETLLSDIFDSEAALLFNSGYAANQAVVSSIPQKGDTILYDQLAHVCLKEGAWLSKADSSAFYHNDLQHLESKLKNAKGNVYVVTETIFSMDGDIAPIQEILDLCEKYGAWLIVDEAHSTGVYGARGSGMLVESSLHHKVLARVYTFGKAMGVHGACVAASREVVDYLINFARPFIYTTSLPPHSVISIICAFQYLSDQPEVQRTLYEKIDLFNNSTQIRLSDTSIHPLLIPGNEACRIAAQSLQKDGFDVRPILAPTVKAGEERLRISLHVHNTDEQIMHLADCLKKIV